MAADNTSMSVLGQFYDALIAASEDQGQKYGNNSKPDFVPGVVSDAFAEGMVAMGTTLGATNVATYAANDATNYAFGKFTIGKLNINSLMPINLAQIAPTQTFGQGSLGTDTVADASISGATGEGLKAELKVEYSNPNDIILDPRKTIDKAVEGYKEQLIKIRNAKIWAGVGEVAQKSASYISLKSDGVPNDVAAAIINAGVKDPEGIVFEQTKRAPDKDKKGATAPIEGWPEASDFPKRESKPFIPFNASKVDNVLGTSMGMFAGITDVEGRSEFAEHVKNELMPKATESYNLRTGGTGRKGENFYDLFAEKDSDGNNIIARSKKDQLFDPALGGNSKGDLLQTSLLDVLGRQASDTSLSPRLRGNLTALYNKVSNDDQAFTLFHSLGNSLGKGTFKAPDGTIRPMDLTPNVQVGVKSLAGHIQSGGNSRLASSLMGAADRMTAYDGTLSPMEKVGYMAARWNSIPAMDKWISPAMIIMGDAGGFSSLVNGLGGITGSGPINATKPWLGLEMMKVFGKDNATTFRLSDEKGEDSNRLMKWAYGVPKGMEDASKNPVFKKDAAGNIVKDKHGNPIQLMDMNYDTTLSQWGRVNWVVSANSNQLQKAAYAAYVFHPVNIVKGALNGSLGEHLMWMGSGHGRMFENKDFSKVFKGKDFGDMLKRQNRGQINAFKDQLMSKYKSTGDVNYLRAHRVTRVMDFMNRPKYKWVVNNMEKIHKIIGLPGQIQKKAMELAKRAALKLAMKVAAKIGAQVLLESILAAFTAGASLLLTRGYAIANAVTFGLLDKIVFGTIKFTLELIVAIALGIFGLLLVTGGVLLLSGQILLVAGLGMGGGVLWPPDPNYVPVIVARGDPYGGVNPTGTPGPLPPIDWDDYDDFSDNACPIQTTDGKSVTYCSQGPNGTYSHHGRTCPSGNPCNYAIDMAPGNVATQVVAPEDGKVYYTSISCGSGGVVVGVKFVGNSGTTYVFYHVVKKDTIPDGSTVTKGTIIGAMIIGASTCSSGSHVHMEVWKGGSLDPRPDAAYTVMCNLSPPLSCSGN